MIWYQKCYFTVEEKAISIGTENYRITSGWPIHRDEQHERQCQTRCHVGPLSFMVHLALCRFCRAYTLPRARKWFSAAINVISKTRCLYRAIRGSVERPTDAFWCRITANVPSTGSSFRHSRVDFTRRTALYICLLRSRAILLSKTFDFFVNRSYLVL